MSLDNTTSIAHLPTMTQPSSTPAIGMNTTRLMIELAAGSVAGVTEYTVCQPVDIVLTRRMLASGSTSQASTGIIGDIVGLIREGGVSRLYRGLGPQVLAAVPATCGMYVGERSFGRMFENIDGGSAASKASLAGFCSGFTETAAVCPFEVIKVRMQSKAHVGKYLGTFHCFRTVIREEGYCALYNGAPSMAFRNCIFNGIFFGGSHLLREHVFRVKGTETVMENFRIDVMCGLMMGAIATPPKMPFFVVKTRLQGGSAGRYTNMGTVATMRKIAREEGVLALWRGSQAAIVRMSLGSAVCLASFRALSDQVDH